MSGVMAVQGANAASRALGYSQYVNTGEQTRADISEAIVKGAEQTQARGANLLRAVTYDAMGRTRESVTLVGSVVDIKG